MSHVLFHTTPHKSALCKELRKCRWFLLALSRPVLPNPRYGRSLARIKHPPGVCARAQASLNEHPLPALRARNGSTPRSAERLSFKSAGRFTCRRLTFTVKSRAAFAAGYHSLNDALRIYGTVAGTCFSCSWLLAIFIRICERVYIRIHA